MEEKMGFERISELGELLCQYCKCTEYGLYMGIQHGDSMHCSCEWEWCGEAYDNYLEV